MTEFLSFLREADPSMLEYRVLKNGDKGEDVLTLKKRMKELGAWQRTELHLRSFRLICFLIRHLPVHNLFPR